MKRFPKVLSFILWFLAVFIAFLTLWLVTVWGDVSVESLIFTLSAPTEGADMRHVMSCLKWVGLPCLVFAASWFTLFALLKKKSKIKTALERIAAFCAIPALLATVLYFNSNYDIIGFIRKVGQTTEIYQNGIYTTPEKVKIAGGDTNNLILIYLESVETAFFDTASGGACEENCMPELGALAVENISFSNTEGYGGPLNFYGTDWSIASNVAHMAGLPLSMTVDNYMYEDAQFMPGAYMMGDLMKEEYLQELLLAQSTVFAGIRTLFGNHGGFEIYDIENFYTDYDIPIRFENNWGLQDRFLFEVAKERIGELYARSLENGKKFSIHIATLDCHTPGYPCELCPDTQTTAYRNVYRCHSMQVAAFIEWCRAQEWFENTTIVLTGDHPTMAAEQTGFIPKDYPRTTYNCIINSRKTTDNVKNRQFTRTDMFPTILSAMGYEIEGSRLALGTDLFSDRPTLSEEYEFEYIDGEVRKNDRDFMKKLYGERVVWQ